MQCRALTLSAQKPIVWPSMPAAHAFFSQKNAATRAKQSKKSADVRYKDTDGVQPAARWKMSIFAAYLDIACT